jgi:hypothetical protein
MASVLVSTLSHHAIKLCLPGIDKETTTTLFSSERASTAVVHKDNE